MFGKLTSEAFKHEMSQNMAVIGMFVTGIVLIALITYLRRWKWLWKEWCTTVDPKRIGIMYIVVSLVMFVKGFADALMMRLQQALSVGEAHGFISSSHFQEVFSSHGTTMIFFVAMGLMFGFMNLIIPLQIGARDVAFPFLNAVSFWLFTSGAALTLVSLALGKFSATGWLAYPPLSGIEYSPGEGVDYWIWALQIAGVGSTFGGINFLVTILKMRCPGMTMMTMPIFTWSCLCAMVLVIFAFPILTATLFMLTLDRYLGMHFFTAGSGGNPMMYINLIWAWGHPEVYILILPVFGIFSEVVPTFSEKRLFGYTSMVIALALITILSFLVWLHHFFTMGASPNVNAFFAIMTMLIAIPTGVKIFNWLFTKFRGRVHFSSPMLWFFAFLLNFTVAGMTGILLAVPPVDFQVHNSLFLIAHFHGMVIGGVLFGLFAGFTYWFPKVTGFFLDERLNRLAFWCWMGGFLLAFMPLYMLGFMGATRRLDHYETATGWHPLFIVAGIGALIILAGATIQFLGLFWSIYQRKKNWDYTYGDPWNARTLEWSTPSPPPIYNFATLPIVDQIDPLWAMKRGTAPKQKQTYEDIYLPVNTSTGVFIGLASLICGFAMTWHIFWLAIMSFAAILALIIHRLCSEDEHELFKADDVARIEKEMRGEKMNLTIYHEKDPNADISTPDPHQDTFSRTVLGFWVYLMTDCLLFASLFAAHAVLAHNTFGGPSGKEIFSLTTSFTETMILLFSSVTCGFALLTSVTGKKNHTSLWLLATFLLGASFIFMEAREFAHLVDEGFSWQRSAFLSSFFALVGTHGLHVSFGLLWMLCMLLQVHFKGITLTTFRRLVVFSLFWHFLDVIWIFIFTFVYLLGVQ